MAIRHRQIVPSKEGVDATDRSSKTSLAWLLSGSNVIDDMRAYIDANSAEMRPPTLDGLIYRSQKRECLFRNFWRWEMEYVEADRSDAEDKLETGETALFSFDTSGGTTVIFGSDPANVTSYARTGVTATDHEGAINVSDREVKGTTIVLPALKVSYRKRFAKAALTVAYVKELARLTGTTNQAAFLSDWSIGELLFLGATGQQGDQSDPEITFSFAAAQNETGLTIGQIAGIAKGAHDYIWVEFEPAGDATANRLARRPLAAYVHKVYAEADWSVMGL